MLLVVIFTGDCVCSPKSGQTRPLTLLSGLQSGYAHIQRVFKAELVVFDNGMKIPCSTFVWGGGLAVDPDISKLETEHSSRGNIMVDNFLKLTNHPNVFALGDCA